MTAAAIYREALVAALKSDTVMVGATMASIEEMKNIGIHHGVTGDSDMVLMAMPQDNIVIIGLMIGRSIRFGLALRQLISEYLARDEVRYNRVLDGFITNAAERFEAGDSGFAMALRNSAFTAWRSFDRDPLPTVDEVTANARRAGPQPKKRTSDPSVN